MRHLPVARPRYPDADTRRAVGELGRHLRRSRHVVEDERGPYAETAKESLHPLFHCPDAVYFPVSSRLHPQLQDAPRIVLGALHVAPVPEHVEAYAAVTTSKFLHQPEVDLVAPREDDVLRSARLKDRGVVIELALGQRERIDLGDRRHRGVLSGGYAKSPAFADEAGAIWEVRLLLLPPRAAPLDEIPRNRARPRLANRSQQPDLRAVGGGMTLAQRLDPDHVRVAVAQPAQRVPGPRIPQAVRPTVRGIVLDYVELERHLLDAIERAVELAAVGSQDP